MVMDLVKFLCEFELFIIYLLLGPSKRFQTASIFEAISFLNKKDFKSAISKITLKIRSMGLNCSKSTVIPN